MYILMVRLKVKKENIDDFIKESIKDAVGSVDIEPGCRRFDIIQDQTDPTLFAFCEVYDDEEAFKAHGTYDHFKTWFETTKPFYDLEIDMNQSDYDGRTALHLAACENHIEIVQFLLNIAKVNKNPKDRWNKTPLDEAIKLNHTEIIDLLQ